MDLQFKLLFLISEDIVISKKIATLQAVIANQDKILDVPIQELYLNAGIVLILLAVSQFIFQNQNRRKYYIANYITVGANTVAAIYYAYWGISNILLYKAKFLTIDFAELKKRNEALNFRYTESTFWFDASKYVFGFLLVVAAVNVFNMLWKIWLMNNEKKLVKAGKEGKAA